MTSPDPALSFVFKMALRNALKMVRGLRKQIGDSDEDVMTTKLLAEIGLSNYEIVHRATAPGHTFPAPIGPLDPDKTIRDAVIEAQRLLAAYAHPDSGKDREATISALLAVLDRKTLLDAIAATAQSERGPG